MLWRLISHKFHSNSHAIIIIYISLLLGQGGNILKYAAFGLFRNVSFKMVWKKIHQFDVDDLPEGECHLLF